MFPMRMGWGGIQSLPLTLQEPKQVRAIPEVNGQGSITIHEQLRVMEQCESMKGGEKSGVTILFITVIKQKSIPFRSYPHKEAQFRKPPVKAVTGEGGLDQWPLSLLAGGSSVIQEVGRCSFSSCLP